MSYNYFNYPTVGHFQQFGYGHYRPRRRGFDTFSYEGMYRYNNRTGERKLDFVDVGIKVGVGVAAIAVIKSLLGGGKGDKGGTSTGSIGNIKTRGGDVNIGPEAGRNAPTQGQ